MNLLIVEDNLSLVEALDYTFQNEKYNFAAAASISEAKKYLENQKIDMLILDINLPDGNGLEFYRRQVLNSHIPTIFLTAIDDEETIVTSLNLGADDYITKPFSTKELIARINRVYARVQKNTILRWKEVAFNLDKMTVLKGMQEVSLTSLELKIFHFLVLNANRVVTRGMILDKIWEWTGNDVEEHTVTVYIKRIREKVGEDIITTVKGLGYRVDRI